MKKLNFKDKNLYYIGGIVRDELLGLSEKQADIDITYVGNAIEFCKNLDMGKILQINDAFGTVRMKINDEFVDFASTRKEVYDKKGHLPVITEIGCSLKEDVLRRDFTVNALAKSLYNDEIVDYTSGIQDLKDKKLRVLHSESFIDDPTRIVRGLKFSVRFGFELEKRTKILQDKYLENVNRDMCYKRLKQELEDAFNLNKQEVLDKFVEQKIYKLISDKNYANTEINIEELIKKYEVEFPWIVYLGNFDLEKFDLTSREQKIISDYKMLSEHSIKDDFELYKKFRQCNKESVLLFAIYKNYDFAISYLDNLADIKLEITGDDLIRLGYKPDENFSKCLDFVLSEKFKNQALTKKDELIFAKNFFNKL